MSNSLNTFKIIRGRKPGQSTVPTAEIAKYLENFVKEKGVCKTSEIIISGEERFKRSRSIIYKAWGEIKDSVVFVATDDDLKRYDLTNNFSGHTIYWIHIENSKILGEFRELIVALTRSTSKNQFLGLLSELGENRFQNYLKNGPIDGIDQLVGLLMLMLNKHCPMEVSRKYGLTKLEINLSEITEYAHVVASYLKKMNQSSYIGIMYGEEFSSMFREELHKLVVENMTVSRVYELLKHISFIVSDINNDLFNEVIFSSFKQILTADQFEFDKIYGGIHNLEQLIYELTKEGDKKKLQYKYWRYMWQIILASFDKIPAEVLNKDERIKLAITVNNLSNLNTHNGPNRFNEVRILIDRLRELCA